jgi:hypothetical protein
MCSLGAHQFAAYFFGSEVTNVNLPRSTRALDLPRLKTKGNDLVGAETVCQIDKICRNNLVKRPRTLRRAHDRDRTHKKHCR